MRPGYLEMSAWGPYKDVVKIDFEEFDRGALFLVTGPTGSGKTTIFDGICFALYGDTSGREREKNTLRSDFAQAQTATYVKFIFTHNGLTYEVYRNPEYMRPKKRKNAEGMPSYTVEKENAILKLPDAQVLEGVTVVNRKLQELLCLDHDQFKQISMLAQGEFDRMLIAPGQEKTRIFRGIFGTQRFDLFTKLLKQRAAESYKKVSEYTSRMEEVVKIHTKGEAQLQALAKETYVNYDVLEQKLAERMAFYAEEKKRLADQVAEQENALRKQYALYEQALQQRQRQEQLEQARLRYGRLLDTKGQYEAAKKRIWQAEEAEALALVYEAFTEAGRACEGLEKQRCQAEVQAEAAQRQYLAAEAKQQEAYVRWQRADMAYKRASIGIAAEMLKEGQPCPVCGSLEHPSPFQPQGDIPDLKEVERLKRLYEQEQRQQLLMYGQVQAALEVQRTVQQEFQKAKASLGECAGKWQVCLQDSIFQTQEAFLQGRLSKAEQQKCQQQVKKWEDMVTSTKAVLEHMTKELACTEPLDVEAIEGAYTAAKKELDEARVQEADICLREAQMRSGLEALRENRRAAEVYRREYGIVKELENMAVGNNSKRLVFEQYVLSSYFEDILTAANIRFRHMTMDRYEMVRKQEVSDARTKDHLDILIADHYTGKLRPVSTLSGGERFHASLSLALGMSDVIQAYQGGIQVEALFVDEGFGSLDEDALQAACDTLYQLTQGDKLVGIISHVESLKQRIDNRIEICKTNMGSSLKVIIGVCETA